MIQEILLWEIQKTPSFYVRMIALVGGIVWGVFNIKKEEEDGIFSSTR